MVRDVRVGPWTPNYWRRNVLSSLAVFLLPTIDPRYKTKREVESSFILSRQTVQLLCSSSYR